MWNCFEVWVGSTHQFRGNDWMRNKNLCNSFREEENEHIRVYIVFLSAGIILNVYWPLNTQDRSYSCQATWAFFGENSSSCGTFWNWAFKEITQYKKQTKITEWERLFDILVYFTYNNKVLPLRRCSYSDDQLLLQSSDPSGVGIHSHAWNERGMSASYPLHASEVCVSFYLPV